MLKTKENKNLENRVVNGVFDGGYKRRELKIYNSVTETEGMRSMGTGMS